MALQMTIDNPHVDGGSYAMAYARIADVHLDFNGVITVTVFVYVTRADRVAGAKRLAAPKYIFRNEAYNDIRDALVAANVSTRAVIYAALKTLPQFSAATDVLE